MMANFTNAMLTVATVLTALLTVVTVAWTVSLQRKTHAMIVQYRSMHRVRVVPHHDSEASQHHPSALPDMVQQFRQVPLDKMLRASRQYRRMAGFTPIREDEPTPLKHGESLRKTYAVSKSTSNLDEMVKGIWDLDLVSTGAWDLRESSRPPKFGANAERAS
jgi:hypothetical protein